MSAADNYKKLLEEIQLHTQSHEPIQLVVVSKMHSWNEMEPVYQAGCRIFGENRIEKALQKMEQAPKDIQWHFIGHLQKNKVRKVVGKFTLIHSVDSYELAEKICTISSEYNLTSSILLQVNTSGELSKQGMDIEECLNNFEKLRELLSVNIQGLMTMAPLTEDNQIIAQTFRSLKNLQQKLSLTFNCKLPYLSMGMSNDYLIAIEEGSNLLRVGTKIWAN